MIDGGLTDEQLETMSQLASNEVHEATRKLTQPEELDPAGAADLLEKATERLAKISDTDPEPTAREQIKDEPPNRKIDVSGETSGHFYTDLELAVESVRVSEIYEPGPNSTRVASLTVKSELGTFGFWMSLEEWLEFREAVDEVAEYVEAAVAEELEQARRKAGKA